MGAVATEGSGSGGSGEGGPSGAPAAAKSARRARRVRMTGKERREQLLDVGRALFAERGFEGTSVEEIAHKAGVSKPVVYEHFGGKEGLYAVVVDREMRMLLDMVTTVDRWASAGAAGAGGVRTAGLHRAVDGRFPHSGAGFAGGAVDGHVRVVVQ